jgi:hypothetical protein
MKKKQIFVFTLISLFLLCACITFFSNFNGLNNFAAYVPQKEEEKNDWSVVSAIKENDSLQKIQVIYQEKYGAEKTIYCKVVFENIKTGEYKCLSPEIGTLVLQKSNLNSFKISRIK